LPEIRKEILLVMNDHPNTPRELIRQLDERLATLKVDEVDLFLAHQFGYRGEVRRLFAARRACPNRLDFASHLPHVDRHLA
jgi:aryl-alcohol dehydrogenase-like predicted oxidoreductase